MIRRSTTALAALSAVLLLIGLAAASAPVAAQTDGNATATPQETERIDSQTVLVSSSFDALTGTATVTLRSESLQQVTIVDGSYIMQGGEATVRKQMLKPGETSTIEIPAEKVNGYVSLSISTPNTLYGELIKVDSSIFSGQATWRTAQVAGITGFVGGFIAILLVAFLRVRGGRTEVDQVA